MNKVRKILFFTILASLALSVTAPLLCAGEQAPHWSYEGEDGPEHWGEIADLYRMCSEGVAWVVLKTSVEASAEQIARFKERVGPATNRPVQPHNARLILD